MAARLDDWERAEHEVSQAYFPHTLTPLASGAHPHLEMRVAQLGAVRLARFGWGAEVSIDTRHPGAYAVNIPLKGSLESTSRGHDVLSTSGHASIFLPDTAASLTRWSEGCEIVGMKIDRSYLEREMAKILGIPDAELPPHADLTTESGRSLLALLNSVVEQVRSSDAIWRNELVASQLAGALTSAFVLAAVPGRAHCAPRPRIIKRVLDRVHENPELAWTTADMAEVAGVSVRRLQEGFREYLGRSPRDHLLDVRLERIHHELAAADPTSATVTDVALKWGIAHMGRFAAAYRRKFGKAPSETLRG